MAPSRTETPAQANARFTTIFQQHGGPNKHKHVPSRATLQRWQAGDHSNALERHWASVHLEFANNGAFFKATRKNDCAVTVKGKGDTRVQKTKKARPAMQIFALEDWGARILAAHVDASGNHRGRDSTYRWARDPVHGLNPDEAPAGHAFVKAPPKEAIIQFLRGCTGPFSSLSSSSSSLQALAPPAAPPAADWAAGVIDPALLSLESDLAAAPVSAEEAMATLQAGMLHQFGMQPEVQQELQVQQQEAVPYLGQLEEEDFALVLGLLDDTTTTNNNNAAATTTTTLQDAPVLDMPAEEDLASFDPALFQAFADEASALLLGEEEQQQQQEPEQPQEATDIWNATGNMNQFFDFEEYYQE
ncbi:hypothetical protein SLS58_005601 [Diplodia intermedia]|uniref:Uncharacterized protein n=1 Tax=Diplodia intermedia TaxID=856260 RepID=A0ABR3TR48_9PEZI